ncbi:MAG TPA: hypothetical protein DEH78_19580, partial [Solibacterales bacterium]|nr:hypothetical protein [Bryobacterales bacterium]
GAGGMGEVFKARDSRLNRFVALKTLLPAVAADEARLKRFLLEARATSSLNHPNIGHLYEIGEDGGTYYLALEYVEGPTLGAHLQSGPLALPELLDLAVQAADALSEAHSRGVLHRDLKPDNLMIDRRGQLKVLDFGLARIQAAAPTEASTTLTQELTAPGVVLGTPRYMSPEQALGRTADGRSDLFSLGAVLYQMATGALPFHGASAPEVMDAILHQAPTPPVRLNPRVPAELERIILRSIEKDPALRYQTAADLLADLKRLKRDLETAPPPPAPQPRRLWIVAAALAAAAAAAFLILRPKPDPPVQPAAEMVLRPILTSNTREVQPSISPDGKTVAYAWEGEGGGSLDIFVKLIDAGSPLRLTVTPEPESWPLWSPDGKYVAFQREKGDLLQVLVMPSLGGAERLLLEQKRGGLREAESSGFRALYGWHPDGRSIVYVASGDSEPLGLVMLDVESGSRRRLTTAPPDTYSVAAPVFVAGGSHLAFIRFPQFLSGSVDLLDIKDGTCRTVMANAGNLRAIAAVPGGQELLLTLGSSEPGFRLRLDTSAVSPIRLPRGASYPSLSADGARIVVEQTTLDTNIWHAALTQPRQAAPPSQWIASTYPDFDPRYSPQQDRIAFVSRRSGEAALWIADRAGRTPQQVPTKGPIGASPNWSPDGRLLTYDVRIGTAAQVMVLSTQGGTPRQITHDPFENIVPSWSRDGRWIYYSSNRTGRHEIWRIPAEGGASEQVTTAGGFEPEESSDGKYLYFSRSREAPALIRRTPNGSEETLIPDLSGRFWALGKEGVYHTNAARDQLLYFDFASRTTRKLLPLTKPVLLTQRHISVSPDGKELLWVQTDSQSSDIALVEYVR